MSDNAEKRKKELEKKRLEEIERKKKLSESIKLKDHSKQKRSGGSDKDSR